MGAETVQSVDLAAIIGQNHRSGAGSVNEFGVSGRDVVQPGEFLEGHPISLCQEQARTPERNRFDQVCI